MHHPGPPRFTSVGESVELAPRNPDPDGTFTWTIADAPADSAVQLPDDPVVHFAPDAAGTYVVRLDAPDGSHDLTVRAFPDERRPARFELPAADLPAARDEFERLSVVGPFNDQLVGRDRPTHEDGSYVYETRLPPGEHPYAVLVDDDFGNQVADSLTVPGPGRPRVHLDATVKDDAVVVAADVRAPPDAEADSTVEFYTDDRDALDRSDVSVDGDEARIPLSALTDRTRVHAVPVGERYGVADALALAPEGGDVTVERLNDPPEWAETATIYEIFVREFAGDTPDATFEELERRVPYLESLGVDCVWLTPVLGSPTRHGYHITDFFDTADDLGSRAEFESFVDACHESDIRVVFDLVINHSSRDHPYFQMSAAGVDEYRDWYVWEDGDDDRRSDDASASNGRDANYQRYFNWELIPNFNYDSLAVREFLLSVVDEWAGVVDGFRCDVAWGVPHGFWKEVRERVRTADSEFLLLDETIPRDPEYHELEFDMHYDTTVYHALREIGRGEAPASDLLDAARAHERTGFPDAAVHLRYVENHDEDRYLEECGRAALTAAAAATFTLPGAPMMYYGQERGNTEYRGPMRWHDGDGDLTAYHRRLVEARSASPALERGRLDAVEWSADTDRAVAYARELDGGDGDAGSGDGRGSGGEDRGGERVVVVLNFGAEPATVEIGEPVDDTDLLTGERASTDGGVTVNDAVVLRASE